LFIVAEDVSCVIAFLYSLSGVIQRQVRNMVKSITPGIETRLM
jgi:hypothetical protein